MKVMQVRLIKISIFMIISFISNLDALDYDLWTNYKKNFISEQGRVIDRFNKDITHTESLGYGMFFAVSYGDYKTFVLIREWLHQNIEMNKNDLYGWKWGKRENGSWGMLDLNNATDGDMWIAYSLILAYEKWSEEHFLNEAKILIEAIKKHTIIKAGGKNLLLPSQFGFVKDDHLKLNPSYTIPFIFDKFAIYNHDKIWKSLIFDSIDMFKNSAIGNLKIHPDWIKLDLVTLQYDYFGNESIFGFDSIRTPLFLAYQYKLTGDEYLKELLRGYAVFMEYIKKLEKYIYQIDFKNHKIRFKYPPYGFLVVYKYLFELFKIQPPTSLQQKIEEGLKNESDNYYSYSLLLFTDIFH
jgi:endo-1,4-beta-D-glucanase Y